MRGAKRLLAVFVVVSILMYAFPPGTDFFVKSARADGAGELAVGIARDNNGAYLLTDSSVTLEWPVVTGAIKYDMSYIDHTGTLQSQSDIAPSADVPGVVRASVTGLQKDYIYDFTVTAYMSSAQPQTYVRRVLTGTTFTVTNQVTETGWTSSAAALPGGGKEAGSKPALRFKWKIPKYWNGYGWTLAFDNGPAMDLTKLIDYDINLGTDSSGTNKTQLKVRYGGNGVSGQYICTMATSNSVRTVSDAVHVNDPAMPGYMYFDCYGPDVNNPSEMTWNVSTNYPAAGQDPGFNPNNMPDYPVNPDGTISFTDLRTVYYDPDITPGTVYRLKIQPVFRNRFLQDVDPGVPGSDLLPAYLPSSITNGFAYTPLRFQITKDSANNLLVTVFKVNQSDADSSSLANFAYMVEFANNAQFYGSYTSARQTDEFSPGSTVVIYLENKNYNTPFYYRVTAKAPNRPEILNSTNIVYTISQDQSLPPLPEGLEVASVTPVTGSVDYTFYDFPAGSALPGSDVKSSQVKLRWKKPSTYNEILNGGQPLFYHVLLSTTQTPVAGSLEQVSGLFGSDAYSKTYATPSDNGGYREILKIDMRSCRDDGSGYLEWTIDGLNLFKAITYLDAANPSVETSLANPDRYPTYLLPNKIYYIKMYAAKDTITPTPPKSDTSLPVSFTTGAVPERLPPSPVNFRMITNEMRQDGATGTEKPHIVLEWQKVGINPADYVDTYTGQSYAVDYELYMSDKGTDTGSFTKIGTTEASGVVSFSGFSNSASPVVDASLSDFTGDPAVQGVFGDGLKPDTTYYFIALTKLRIGNDTKFSKYTQYVAVTTLKGKITQPGDESRIPRAPGDFSIARDTQGNLLLDSSGVSLKWTELESDVKYTLIRTPLKIDGNADLNGIREYKGYLNYKGETSGTADSADTGTLSYDSRSKGFLFSANDLFPNTIYYFSIRAERKINAGQPTETVVVSPWVTVPVTTALIEAPASLDVVLGYEIGVSWTEDSIYASDGITVSLNGTAAPAGTVFISEEPKTDGSGKSTFYARIVSLQPNQTYNANIKGTAKDASGLVHSFNLDIPYSQVDPVTNTPRGITRDPMHQIDVKWKGKDGYSFELAVKGETDSDYTILRENSGFAYTSIEKPVDLVGTGYSMYYARISSLKSNAKYYIKVRSKEHNSLSGEDNYSRYTVSASSRTEFSQGDYDQNDQKEKEKAIYSDKAGALKESLYWVLENTASTFKVKIKGEKALNYIDNSYGSAFVVNLSSPASNSATRGAVYIPLAVMRHIFERNKSLDIRMPGLECVIRPDTLDLDNAPEIKNTRNDTTVKEIYLYIESSRTSSQSYTFPSGIKPASDVYNVGFQVDGLKTNTDSGLEKKILDTLDSYIASGLATLQNTDGSLKDTPQKLNDVINQTVDSIMKSFQSDIRDLVESPYYGLKQSVRSLSAFANPLNMIISGSFPGKGVRSGYIYKDNVWKKLTTLESASGSPSYTISSMSPGSFILLSTQPAASYSVPDGHWAAGDFNRLASKYELRDIFKPESSSNIDGSVSVYDTVRLIARILSGGGQDAASGTASDTAKKLGLPGYFNYGNSGRNLTREELASLVMKVYQMKLGVDIGGMKTGKVVMISDGDGINKNFYKSVELCIDLGMMNLDEDSDFRPKEEASWAQVFTAYARLLKLLGEL